MPMSSGGHVASSSECATRPKVRESGLTGYAVPTRRSLLIGRYVMATAEHREPCDSRGSCTVLGAPGGETPPGDSSSTTDAVKAARSSTSASPPKRTCARLRRCVRFAPIVLQKSQSRLCEIEICNNRIGASVLLNRCCSFVPDLESMFRDQMQKILLQHNPPKPDSCTATYDVHGCNDLLDHLVGAGE